MQCLVSHILNKTWSWYISKQTYTTFICIFIPAFWTMNRHKHCLVPEQSMSKHSHLFSGHYDPPSLCPFLPALTFVFEVTLTFNDDQEAYQHSGCYATTWNTNFGVSSTFSVCQSLF